MIASQIVFGVLDVIFYYQKQFGYFSFYVNVLIQLVLIMLWCSFDSAVRRQHFSFREGAIIVIIGIFGIPAYFWKSRTHKEFFISLGGLFLYIIPTVTYYLAWLVTGKVMQFFGYYASLDITAI